MVTTSGLPSSIFPNCSSNKDCSSKSFELGVQFVEISGPDGMKKRFATGTKASFAVDRFNSILKDPNLSVVCIAAVKEGEDPIEFGPDVELILFDATWTLQIVQEGLLFILLPGLHCLYPSFS